MDAKYRILLGLVLLNMLCNYGTFGRAKPVNEDSRKSVDESSMDTAGSAEKQKKYYLDHFGDSLLDKRSKVNFIHSGPFKRYYLDHFGDSLLDKRTSLDDQLDKRYYLDHFGDNLLDKKSFGGQQLEKKYYLDHFGDSLLDKRSDQLQKRYYLDHFGDSLLD